MKKNKNNGFLGVTICMFGFLSLICAWFIFQNQNNSKDKKELQGQITKQKEENEQLKKDVESANKQLDDLNSLKDETCEYTQTFSYLGDYKYTSTVPNHKFIVVDRFQENSPIILEIDTKKFDIDFKLNRSYEITFVGSLNDDNLKKTTIKTIKETDKVGLGQVQETCGILKRFNNANTVTN